MLPHKFRLKVGIIVILLRNINLDEGLANGTRLIIRHLSANVIQAEIVTGDARTRGRLVCIPRLSMTVNPGEDDLPFTFNRCQFPIRPAFVMLLLLRACLTAQPNRGEKQDNTLEFK